MHNYFYIASDLAGLLTSYISDNNINHAGSLLQRLKQDGADVPGARIIYADWCEYLVQLHEITGDDQLGIKLGLSVKPSHCGVLGYLSLNCEYLGEALLHFERYQSLLYDGGQGGAELNLDRMRFVWPYHEVTLGVALSNEVLVFGMASLVRKMLNRNDINPLATSFTHTAIADKDSYQKTIGGGDILFNADSMYVDFSTEYLALPIVNSDPMLRTLLDQQAQAMLAVLPNNGDFEQLLKTKLLKILQEGEPTLERLALAMCTSSRTLHRRLAELGINFASLLRRTRTELAIQYLKEGALSYSEIAFLLGYSEQSAFSRAFKQWTGKTPRQFSAK